MNSSPEEVPMEIIVKTVDWWLRSDIYKPETQNPLSFTAEQGPTTASRIPGSHRLEGLFIENPLSDPMMREGSRVALKS